MRRSRHFEPVSRVGWSPPAGELFTILSGVDGVGRTTIAMNFALQSARAGIRTLLVDARDGMLPAAVRDSQERAVPPSLHEVVADHLIEAPFGLRILLMDEFRWAWPRPLHRAQWLTFLRHQAERVVIDAPAGLTAESRSLAKAADRAVLVTTPDVATLAHTYGFLKTLARTGVARGADLLINRVRHWEDADRSAARLQEAADRFLGLTLTTVGGIAEDRYVALATRARVPVTLRHPRSRASMDIQAACEHYSRIRKRPLPIQGLWARVASVFL